MLSNRMVGVLSAKRSCVSLPQKRCNHSGGAKLSCGETVSSYMEMKQYIDFLTNSTSTPLVPLCVETRKTPLLAALRNIHSPACVTGTVESWAQSGHENLVRRLSPQELLSLSRHNTPLSGADTNSLLDASWLDESSLSQIARGCDFVDIGSDTTAASCLFIHDNSTHTLSLNHTVPENLTDKLVVILGSEFTGGEIEVTHDGNTATINGPWSWFACTKQCKLNFKPVSSGTRELLIYNITAKPPAEQNSNKNASELVGSPSDRWNPDLFFNSFAFDSDDEDIHVDPYEQHTPPSWRKHAAASADRVDGLSYLNSFKRCKALLYNNTMIPADLQISVELSNHESVIIALDALYTTAQCNSADLQGADRALYDLLSERFHIDLVYATVCYSCKETTAALFSTALIKQSLSTYRKVNTSVVRRSKIIVPNKLRQEHVLDESNGVYIVSGLRVSAK